jgi:hypothetical protein
MRNLIYTAANDQLKCESLEKIRDLPHYTTKDTLRACEKHNEEFKEVDFASISKERTATYHFNSEKETQAEDQI